MMNKKGSLFIVTGPSGAGKGTVLAGLSRRLSNVFYSVSATTRQPRPGEVDGKNYYFKTKEEFEGMIARGEMLEYAEYVGNYYGTPEGPVNEMLEAGNDVILEIEVQGALIVKNKRPDAILVFITPPSFDILEERLRNRGTEKEEVVKMRLEKARSECSHMNEYEYIIVNDVLDEAIQDLSSVVRAARCRSTQIDIKLV